MFISRMVAPSITVWPFTNSHRDPDGGSTRQCVYLCFGGVGWVFGILGFGFWVLGFGFRVLGVRV